MDPNSMTLGVDALNARSDQRVLDMQRAIREGAHFWLAGVLYRMSGPSDDALMDAENICGYVQIHCGICGVETNEDPQCHLLS